MNDQVQEIKDRVDIVEVVSSYLTLKKAGVYYKACCPFHNEKTPSMMISPERQSFKCYGCGEGGDVISFIEKIEGLDFYNALKLLASRAGVELKNDSVNYANKEHKADKKTGVFEMNEWAKKVYHYILLNDEKAAKAREYLSKRGLTEQTIKDFEIGYAPDSWDFIIKYLEKKNYKEGDILSAGLATKSERGKVFDRFRGRIMFPINNIMGNTIAFTSRVLVDDGKQAKYINSAESAIYSKGKTIYGLDKAKLAIKEKKIAIMVEGNMDVITCHQAGFKNVVATSGTALTLDQLKILTRYGDVIAFCFDSDNAGQTAMKRAIRMALQNDISIRIISTAPYKDPDEAIKDDPKKFKAMVEAAKPALEYWIDNIIQGKKLTVDEKKKIAKEILPEIKIIASEIEKEHYIQYLAQKLDIKRESIIAALDKSKADYEFAKNNSDHSAKEIIKENYDVVEKICGLIWAENSLINNAKEALSGISTQNERLAPLLVMIKNGQIFEDKLKDELRSYFDLLSIAVLKNLDPNMEGALENELKYLLGRLRSEEKEDLKDSFARKIREAEQKGDKEALKKLLTEFSNLIK